MPPGSSAITLPKLNKTTAAEWRAVSEQIGHADTFGVVPSVTAEDEPVLVRAETSGYIQAVDGKGLFDVGQRKSAVIRMEAKIGAFMLNGEVLAAVWADMHPNDETAGRIRGAFVHGADRTPEQDVEYGIIEIADIAVKALSPGINDTTTALRCIDRLGEILLALGTRNPPPDRRTRDGNVHFVARHTTFDEAVSVAFDQILHFGRENSVIVNRLTNVTVRLEAHLPEYRCAALSAFRTRLRHEPGSAADVAASTHIAGADAA